MSDSMAGKTALLEVTSDTTADQTPLLRVTDLRVTYPGHPPVEAVRSVGFELFPGEVVGLVGESGCGKSTVAKAISGMLPISGGSIDFDGNEVKALSMSRRPVEQTRIQMVFQDPTSSLNPRRTIGAQLADGLQVAERRTPGVPGRLDVRQWLERVGLAATDARRYPRSFSGGQRQRIATARALAAEPSLLIADEPISSLDASTQARVAGIMCKLAAEQNTALLFISHDLSIVRLIADRLLVMYRGEIVERGVTAEVWNDPKHDYTRKLLASIPKPDGKGVLPAG
ncbi:MAG: ATP-binding cassette domain-containing protein [Propionibacteriaceae bacterium]|jgi:peptide/nickel transport system ATP-binding protein|nr:ATP-binding cassette domain-containing protein [Propionibacteriaceae bacterium]